LCTYEIKAHCLLITIDRCHSRIVSGIIDVKLGEQLEWVGFMVLTALWVIDRVILISNDHHFPD